MADGAGRLRLVDNAHEDVVSGNTSHLVRVFGEIAAQPDQARVVRGTVFLGFSSFDADPRPNYLIPEIRHFVATLDAQLPYFPYFLVGDPALNHVLTYVLCLTPFQQGDGRGQYSADDLVDVVHRKLDAVAEFSSRIGDDVHRATEPLMLNLPTSMVKRQPELVARILKAMRLALVGIETSLTAGTLDAESRADVDTLLARACEIASIDRSQYRSQLDVVHALLARITPAVSKEAFQQFDSAFGKLLERVPGRKLRVEPSALRALVRDQEAAAYRFVEVHLAMAASQPGYLQPAAMVAAAIFAETGDRSALLQIERRAEELGVSDDTWMPTTT